MITDLSLLIINNNENYYVYLAIYNDKPNFLYSAKQQTGYFLTEVLLEVVFIGYTLTITENVACPVVTLYLSQIPPCHPLHGQLI